MGFNGNLCGCNCFTLFSIICSIHFQNSYPFCLLVFIEFVFINLSYVGSSSIICACERNFLLCSTIFQNPKESKT